MSDHNQELLLKGIAVVLAFLSFRWIVKIFARTDGKKGLTQSEFLQLAAFVLFYGGIIFILYIEAYRTTVDHKFGDLWLAFMITGLFSVLHMTDVLDKMSRLIELIIKLRLLKGTVTETTTAKVEVKSTEQVTQEVKN